MNTEDVLNDSAKEAEKILNEPSKVDEILKQVEEKLETIPLVGNTLADVPLMISMIKSYITKDYTNVSGKVIALMIGSFIYIVKRKDLIPDNKPFIGHVDDIAVLTLALKLSESELKEYKEWRKTIYGE